jgi:hypothetical protein
MGKQIMPPLSRRVSPPVLNGIENRQMQDEINRQKKEVTPK